MAVIRYSKRYAVPKRPHDKERLISEMKLLGKYGMKNKKELWTVQKQCNDVKRRVRDLLISNDRENFIVNSRPLLNRLSKLGILMNVDMSTEKGLRDSLERALDLTPEKFMERRLQYQVFLLGLARTVHQARMMIVHRHISVNGRIVDKPGLMVGLDEDGSIDISEFSRLRHAKEEKGKKASEDE